MNASHYSAPGETNYETTNHMPKSKRKKKSTFPTTMAARIQASRRNVAHTCFVSNACIPIPSTRVHAHTTHTQTAMRNCTPTAGSLECRGNSHTRGLGTVAPTKDRHTQPFSRTPTEPKTQHPPLSFHNGTHPFSPHSRHSGLDERGRQRE